MKLIKKNSLCKVVLGLFMLAAVVVPTRAMAFSYTDLGTAYGNARALCSARGSSSEYCDRANAYKLYLMAASNQKTDAAKQKYIDTIPAEWRTTIFAKTVKAYAEEVQAGNIGSGSDSSSRINADSNCPEGQVEVAVSPFSGSNAGDNCVGGTNPIYTYLKAIILFMGGAIGLAVVITIIVSGIEYSSSAGNAANITKAKERLTNAVIGLVLYLFLAAILRYLVPQLFS